MKSIVFIGPESTGKTWLSESLATHYNTQWLPEYLRDYFDKYKGVEKDAMQLVAQRQVAKELELLELDLPLAIFDTNIISLKVYHEYYFNEKPEWFKMHYEPNLYSHYFLMDIDIPWEADSQRDSPKTREELFPLFEQALINLGVPYTLISGSYDIRKDKAIAKIDALMTTDFL